MERSYRYRVKIYVVVIFFQVFLFDVCFAFNLSCSYSLTNDHHVLHRNPSVTLKLGNCEWPVNFTYLANVNSNSVVTSLYAINLWTGNSNATLKNDHFVKLDYLHIVIIINSRITQIEEDTFEELIRLEVINLSDNRLTNLPQNLFRRCEKLKELNLSGNRIKTLPELIFSTNEVLSVLDLSYNYLEIINSTELFKKPKIKSLSLHGNRIITIYRNTFSELNSLEFLNMSYNKMSFSVFANCYNTPSASSIPENYIWFVDMAVKTNNCVIDFRHNEITGLPLFGIQIVCTPIHHRCKPLTLLLDDNPLSCDCEGYDLIRYFQNEWSSSVRDVVRINDEPTCTYARTGKKSSFSHVDIDNIYCTLNTCPNCPSDCSCLIHKHTRTVLFNCTGKRLDAFPKNLPIGREDTSEFLMSNNRISSIDGILYPYLVRVLALSHNRIDKLPQNFAKFSQLKLLELNDNNLKILTSDQIKHIATLNLDRLTLGNNPWNCSDCRILSLVKYLQNSSNIITDGSNVTCFSTGKQLVKIDPNTCRTIISPYFFIFVSFPFIMFLSVAFIIWYKMGLKMSLNTFKVDDVERERKIYQYDVFISYAHQDEGYVANLVKKLEARKNPFKICLHARDWVPGEFIVKQMAESVNNSRTSLVILSSEYLRSKWCYSEFRIALTQMLVRRNHKVIAIWLSDKELSEHKLDPDIRLYISTCTYLKYNDERFMNKLESALSH